ncbi:efflux RND transporter periplasmic adaptor subunit [bacterium]|nr:efflux RND transporter periplasmic adaptor subunit [candidate division CSSED10-310 bacterium]
MSGLGRMFQSVRGTGFLTIIIVLIAAAWQSGCKNGEQPIQASTVATSSMAVNVRTIAVQTNTFVESVRLLGETQADKDLIYSAEIAGRLEYLAVDFGDMVQSGQILARIDYEMLKAQADQVRAASDLAKKTYDRLLTLREDELVTQQQIDEANAQLIQAQAQLEQTETALKRSEVKSTISGVVAGKFVEAGEYMMPGTPIVRILNHSTIIVIAQVPETRVPDLTVGADVSVTIDALKDTFTGSLDVVLPQSDPESRTFTVRVKTPNPDRRIMVGMAATLTIAVKKHDDVIVIPQEVVIEQVDGRYVFIRNGDQARKVKVTLGPSENKSVIITDGLKPGDELIVDGHRELVDGQPINIVR